MHTALTVIAQLLPAIAGTPVPAPSIEPAPVTISIPGLFVGRTAVDWRELDKRLSADTGRVRRRTKSIEYSGFYSARLGLHRWLSFTMIPLFIGSYVTGDQILKKSTDAPKWARQFHRPLATATAVVFSVNTITGLWNLWDSRRDSAGRTKRYIHSLLFIAAGAGFTWAGTKLANDAESSQAIRLKHRNVALASMGISVTSWAMMLLLK
jgi:hypothetical protein